MASIALITEGVSDQRMIEAMVRRVFNPNISVPSVYPEDPEEKAGYSYVVNKIKTSLIDILSFNDFVIIHIDSDAAYHDNALDVFRNIQCNRDPQEVINQFIEALISLIGYDLYAELNNKIFFAIPVDSMECWLLPIVYSSNNRDDKTKQKKTTGCLGCCNQKLRTKGLEIDPERKMVAYNELKKEIEKQAHHCEKNPSAKIFVDSLRANVEFMTTFVDNDETS